ncbi:MAG: SixA phosphatase family protein [Rufibacter sp.]
MKNLLVMRHATAAEKEAGQQEIDRELTLFGERQAGEVGLWLKEQQLVPQLVLCSPAVRTRSTLQQVQEAFGKAVPVHFEEVLYHGTEREMKYLVQEVHEDIDTLLVIGHNPTIAFFAGLLLHEAEEPVHFSPATVAVLQFAVTSWEDLRPKSGKLLQLYKE